MNLTEQRILELLNLNKDNLSQFMIVRNGSSLDVHIELVLIHPDCPYCGEHSISHGKIKRTINHPLFAGTSSNIIWYAHRYKCSFCGKTFLENSPFSFPFKRNSIATSRAVMEDLKNLKLTYYDIAKKHNISSTAVQTYLDSWVTTNVSHLPESLGIDEIYSHMAFNNSSYLCVLVDNIHSSLVDILPSRSKYYLSKYFSNFPANERSKVKYVTIDMWQPYKDIASIYLPKATIAVDSFHVIKTLNQCFSKVRMGILRQVPYDSNAYYLLKKWHKLLEFGSNLDNEPKYNRRFDRNLNRRDLLEMTLSISDNLSIAYQLKELYRFFNLNATVDNAASWLDELISKFIQYDIPEYRSFVNTIYNWHDEIINSFMRPIDNRRLSNATTESFNKQIKDYIAISNGVTNFHRFQKRIMLALNKKVYWSISTNLTSNKMPGKPRGKYKKKHD